MIDLPNITGPSLNSPLIGPMARLLRCVNALDDLGYQIKRVVIERGEDLPIVEISPTLGAIDLWSWSRNWKTDASGVYRCEEATYFGCRLRKDIIRDS